MRAAPYRTSKRKSRVRRIPHDQLDPWCHDAAKLFRNAVNALAEHWGDMDCLTNEWVFDELHRIECMVSHTDAAFCDLGAVREELLRVYRKLEREKRN